MCSRRHPCSNMFTTTCEKNRDVSRKQSGVRGGRIPPVLLQRRLPSPQQQPGAAMRRLREVETFVSQLWKYVSYRVCTYFGPRQSSASVDDLNVFVGIRCPDFVIEHGNVAKKNNSTVNNKAIITCKRGYTLIGAKVLTCAMNSTWVPTPPTCQSGNGPQNINI